ncbi:unnamed protein product, partial [Cuscuta europaea]
MRWTSLPHYLQERQKRPHSPSPYWFVQAIQERREILFMCYSIRNQRKEKEKRRRETIRKEERGYNMEYQEAEHSIDSNFRPTRLRLCTRVRRSASSPPVPTPRAVAHSRTRAVAQVLGVAALLLSVRNGPAVFVLKRYLKWLKS